ncbi:lytic murein transglycosylase [Wenxinia saemankumensis]|uniref:Lytic murein transglycosylase n=1 Tax=Wenxinia saemankumensis TaxID=1447782 RepID=A0A1M6DZI5_9RHOB|nr:lytic murein transglycosylase [Wenxinia saemankumensis]SHI78684.1 lytic murein transglycosylase [Wenxinia saemankumensis]
MTSPRKFGAIAALAVLAACGGGYGAGQPVERSPVVQPTAEQSARFAQWVAGFRPRALSEGISPAVYDRAFASATYRPDVIERDRNQAEFSRSLRQYLGSAVTDTRVAEGRAMLARYGSVLDEIEARYGVDREVVVAIWGLESSYGSNRGDIPTISALATLAEDGRRGEFFAGQLIAALRILQNGDVSPEGMVGSWAGAMGHTQFIPTSYQSLAVDFRGDGRRDIWSEDPTDALASTARYLQSSGWTRGVPWGAEVGGTTSIPAGVSTNTVTPEAGGPSFRFTRNAEAIRRYNNATTYIIAVGHLSDRLRGAGPLVTLWPAGERPLTEAERIEMQRLLTAAGYDTNGTDGRVGTGTFQAIRDWQAANGQSVTGEPSLALLAALRR